MQSCKKFQSCRTPLILALCMKNYKIAVNAAANEIQNYSLLLSLQSPMATALAETSYHPALSITTDPSAVAGLWLPSPPPPPPHSDPASFLSRQLSPISPYQVCNHAREATILIITH